MFNRNLRPIFGQRGSALVLTMVVVVGLVALVTIASDNMFGSYKLSAINLDRQRARFAAETVAALVESKLVELASTPNPTSSELDNLNQDFDQLTSDWWGLRGACFTDAQDVYHPASTGLWINGCLVRWRIEPVRVYAKTINAVGGVNGTFTVNTELDPAKALLRGTNTNSVDLSGADPGFFHFRIVAEAYTLKEARNSNERPWDAPASTETIQKSQVHVQAQRVVQLQVINLFKYALFHAQEDARGDIDLQTGDSLTILKGSVHSNAAIYIRGGENNGFTANPRNYHQMACGDGGHNSGGQTITLGAANEPIDVVAVNGIFRMGKTANILLGVDEPAKLVTNPMSVPKRDNDTDRYNLCGDSSSSTRHNINGIPFTLLNDSRSYVELQKVFNGRVRDQSNGGTVVKTLANIPQMAGRPLEYQELVGVGNLYYRNSTTTITRVRPATPQPLYYIGNAGISPTLSDSADPANPTRLPVEAAGIPLYWDGAYAAKDIDMTIDTLTPSRLPDADFPGIALTVDPAVSGVTFSGSTVGDGFNDREAKGYYLERGLLGQGLSTPQYYTSRPASITRTGLVIRERPSQSPVMARPTLAAGYSAANFDLYRKTYAAYLKSQYVVLFAGRNITEYFFNRILNAADNVNYPEQNFIVTEDEFIDSRETSWMAANYGVSPSAYIGGQSYRQNVLTLNVRAIQNFLSSTTSSAIDPVLDGALAKSHFNGLIYVHRTRRSQTYHAINSPIYAWTAPTPSGDNLPFPTTDGKYVAPPPIATSYADLTNVREGAGPYETTRCAVRIRGGLRVDSLDYPNDVDDDATRKTYAKIDWDSTGSDGPANSGLTIITPDRCYIWGDFNTTTHTDPNDSGKQLTVPCAIFSDGITALSANWRDSMWQDYQIWGFVTYGNSKLHDASSTKYITSMVTNNVPNAAWNVRSFGTGGSADTIHLIERWSGKNFVFRGSMVVLNEQRYSKCGHFYVPSILSNNIRVFETGHVEFTFNTDLLTRTGQPPFSPWGFQVTRVVSTVNVFDN